MTSSPPSPSTDLLTTSLSPIAIIREAIPKVPAVKYALGLAAIGAAGSIIVGFLGSSKTTIIVVAVTFVGALLTLAFSRLAIAKSEFSRRAGEVMLWAVVLFFCIFLIFTVSAFATGIPVRWSIFIGIEPSIDTGTKISSDCDNKVHIMWERFNNSSNQTSDALQIADQIQQCAPVEADNLRGAVAFYAGDFFKSAAFFKKAYDLDQTNDIVDRNLGDAYIEIGRIGEAVNAYERIKERDTPIWNYKMGRALLYDGHYGEAQKLLSTVDTSFNEDGDNPGKARILEATALVGMAQAATDSAAHVDFLKQAEQKFKIGVGIDPARWKQILIVTGRTKHEGFDIVKRVLGPLLAEWLQ